MQFSLRTYPDSNYLLKGKKRNTRKRCEICSKLTLKTPERRHIVNFEQVNAGWTTTTWITILIVVEIKKKETGNKNQRKIGGRVHFCSSYLTDYIRCFLYFTKRKSLKDYGKYFLSSLRIYGEEAIKSVASFCRETY